MNEPDTGHTSPLRRAKRVGAAVLHAVPGRRGVLALATDFALPVTASYMAGPPGTTPAGPGAVSLDIPTGLAVAGS